MVPMLISVMRGAHILLLPWPAKLRSAKNLQQSRWCASCRVTPVFQPILVSSSRAVPLYYVIFAIYTRYRNTSVWGAQPIASTGPGLTEGLVKDTYKVVEFILLSHGMQTMRSDSRHILEHLSVAIHPYKADAILLCEHEVSRTLRFFDSFRWLLSALTLLCVV